MLSQRWSYHLECALQDAKNWAGTISLPQTQRVSRLLGLSKRVEEIAKKYFPDLLGFCFASALPPSIRGSLVAGYIFFDLMECIPREGSIFYHRLLLGVSRGMIFQCLFCLIYALATLRIQNLVSQIFSLSAMAVQEYVDLHPARLQGACPTGKLMYHLFRADPEETETLIAAFQESL